MPQDKTIKGVRERFQKLIDNLPSRVCETPKEVVFEFIQQEIKDALESVVPKECEEGQTEQCADVLKMNYLIGKNKGFNQAIEQINQNIKHYIE